METWPEELRDVSVELSGEPIPSVLRTPMGSGAVRQRRIFTVNMEVQQVRWTFKPFQYALFRYFWKELINQGADAFLVDLDFGGGLEQVAAKLVNGKYQYRYNEGYWFITAQLELDEPPYMSTEDYENFTDTLDQDLELLEMAANDLHNDVHEVMPDLF